MANNNQYTIYIRSTKESIPVSKEEFDAYYHDIDLYRRNQQRHGRCVCPRSKWLTCDMDCYTCPFHRMGDELSLDATTNTDFDEERSWVEDMPDSSPLVEDIVTDAMEMGRLYARLCELMPEAVEIGQLRLAGMTDKQISSEIGVVSTTFRSRLSKVKKVLTEEFPEYF